MASTVSVFFISKMKIGEWWPYLMNIFAWSLLYIQYWRSTILANAQTSVLVTRESVFPSLIGMHRILMKNFVGKREWGAGWSIKEQWNIVKREFKWCSTGNNHFCSPVAGSLMKRWIWSLGGWSCHIVDTFLHSSSSGALWTSGISPISRRDCLGRSLRSTSTWSSTKRQFRCDSDCCYQTKKWCLLYKWLGLCCPHFAIHYNRPAPEQVIWCD